MDFFNKHRQKGWFKLISHNNIIFRFIRRIYYEAKMLFHVLQNSLITKFYKRLKGNSCKTVTQFPLSWNMKIGRIKTVEDLKSLLKNSNILFNEGGNTIYIPPQQRLEKLFGNMVMFYPPDAGFKILKHFQPPDKAKYVGGGPYIGQGDSYIRRVLTGSINDQIDAANVLHRFQVGPALYDVAEIITDEVSMTCFVVQHVHGVSPNEKEHEEFLNKLSILINGDTFALVPPEGLKFIDFKSPDCNRNLIKSNETAKLMYVDFQQFIVRDKKKMIDQILLESKNELHFGDTRLFRGGKYLYQSIPGTLNIGKRDIEKRWSFIKKLLQDSGVEVSKRIVLDIGCNAGMMLSCALAEGALWGLGWDSSSVVIQAKRLNSVLGNTRVNFFGANLSESYCISRDIPERFNLLLNNSIIFYLAVWKHFGFMSDLAKIPWKAIVFEGHDGDTFEKLSDKLLKIQSEWNCKITVKSEIRDGDCGTRPIAVFVRD